MRPQHIRRDLANETTTRNLVSAKYFVLVLRADAVLTDSQRFALDERTAHAEMIIMIQCRFDRTFNAKTGNDPLSNINGDC